MLLQSRRIWVLNTWIEGQIEVSPKTGRIVRILPFGTGKADLDFGSLRIVPGFIDVHTHGAYGFDTNDAEPDGLRNWAQRIVSEGVTGFLPTTVTQSEEVLTKALRNVSDVVRGGYPGAQIFGIHMEGPCLNPEKRGAHPREHCVLPDVEQFKRFLEASGGLIRIVTLACELDQEFQLTRFLRENGIVPSLGHSCAGFPQAAMAFANGAGSVTHTFNAMTGFHHRAPGLAGAALRFRDVYSEIICDGLHAAPDALNLFFTAKGPDRGVMVTDSLSVKGLPAGTRALFGGNLIELSADKSTRLVETGALAGSTLRMNEGLRILVEEAGVPWQTAVSSCTINPARLLGLDGRKGSIQAGKDADLVVLNEDYSVHTVFVRGSRHG